MAKRVLRFGLIGCGEIAVRNCEAVLAAPHARLAAAFDVKEELARDLAGRQKGARVCATQEELLGRDDVDAVIISTPHFLHAPMTLAAFKAGKHVLCEKPIARNVAEGRTMVRAAARAGRKLGICFIQRYRPMVEVAREIVQAGRLGRVMSWVLFEMGYKQESYWTGGYTQRARTDWRLKRETAGGGYLIMNLIHNIDYLRYITGQEVVSAKAFGGSFNSPPGVEVEDLISGTLTLSDGGIAIVTGASCVPGGNIHEDRLVGTKGQVCFGGWGEEALGVYLTEPTKIRGQAVPAATWTKVPCQEGKGDHSRTYAVEAFARWVLHDEPYRSPGEDALKSLAVCGAMYRDAGLVKG